MLIKISAKMVQCDSNNFKVLHACILFLSVIKSTVASKFNDEPGKNKSPAFLKIKKSFIL